MLNILKTKGLRIILIVDFSNYPMGINYLNNKFDNTVNLVLYNRNIFL